MKSLQSTGGDKPALDALTETLRSRRWMIVDVVKMRDHEGFPEPTDSLYASAAATFLAHPAMADLARKAEAWEAIERLPKGWQITCSTSGYWSVSVYSEGRNGHGSSLPEAIAAALGDER